LEARNDFTSYIEATLLPNAIFTKVKILFKQLFLKWGYFLTILINSGPKF
ncbi:hypothetical protein QBC45DRAFT_329082, partial [Copromyces sp. CBS 386.78]